MCGISGAWSAACIEARQAESLRRLAHRGPDGTGQFVDEGLGVTLGHVRLAIIDVTVTGAQPMSSHDGAVALSYNGEIYNYRELRAGLERSGVRFRGSSDTEVLLELYLARGMSMLPELNGIFAFALLDRRRGELLLARDALGVKPLYFTEGPQGFSFASEIKGLLPLTDAERTPDQAALDRYLSFQWCPGEGTALSAVRKLGPGEALRVRDGKILERWTWYELPWRRKNGAALGQTDAIAAVSQGLCQAVRRQLVSDVPVGAFLSGGLDSSAVVAFAREQVPDIRCFTVESVGGEDAGETADLPFARRVAAHLGVPLEVVSVDASRMAGDLERMVWQLDEPLGDPAALNVLYICEAARRGGIKVLLSGAGGDDLFTGYRRHAALRYDALWNWLPRWARRGLGAGAGTLNQTGGTGRRLARLFSGAEESGDARLAAYFAWRQRGDLLELYTPSVREAVEHTRPDQPMLDFLAGIPEGRSRLDRMLALEQRFFLADHNLIYTDKMSMAAGVEVRVPFLDLDLVELAARIPDRLKQRGPTGKWVLRKAMEPYLPKDVIYRPKTGFGAPLRRWMRNDLRELVRELLSESSLKRRGLFEPRAVQRLIHDNDSGRRDAAYTLFSLLCIEIWCRRFVDSAGEPPAVSLEVT